jgi:DNA replication protein DnaC
MSLTDQNRVVHCEFCGGILPIREVEVLPGRRWYIAETHKACQQAELDKIPTFEPVENKDRQRCFKYATAGLSDKTLAMIKPHMEIQDALERVKSWNPTQKGLYIEGPNGVGKSHLLAGLANKMVDEKRDCYFLRFGRLIREGLALDDNFEREHLIRKFRETSVLFFDDIGSERLTEYAESVLFEILDERYEARAPVHFSSNISIESLADAISPRVYSRIKGLVENVRVNGYDVRHLVPWGLD